jgi:hexosaminidase
VITPAAQYALDEAVRDIPVTALPPVFPTPISLQKREGRLRLEVLSAIQAGPELQGEAGLAVEYLRPSFAKAAAPVLQLAAEYLRGHWPDVQINHIV